MIRKFWDKVSCEFTELRPARLPSSEPSPRTIFGLVFLWIPIGIYTLVMAEANFRYVLLFAPPAPQTPSVMESGFPVTWHIRTWSAGTIYLNGWVAAMDYFAWIIPVLAWLSLMRRRG